MGICSSYRPIQNAYQFTFPYEMTSIDSSHLMNYTCHFQNSLTNKILISLFLCFIFLDCAALRGFLQYDGVRSCKCNKNKIADFLLHLKPFPLLLETRN
jgi:hypothetical protein